MSRLLIAENDFSLRKLIVKRFTKQGYDCLEASNGSEAKSILKREYFDLLILDLDLGDINGSEVLKLIRCHLSELPVIIITTSSGINSKLDLFNSGCNDYLTKPFYIDELVVRVKKQLEYFNRSISTSVQIDCGIYSFGKIYIDLKSGTLKKSGKDIKLTSKEFSFLTYFLKNRDRIVTKEQLLSRLWDDDVTSPNNSISVYIHKLRRILEDNPSKPVFLTTRKGLGYFFTLQPA